MARHRLAPIGASAPRSVRTGRPRHRHRLTRAQLTTRRLTAAGVFGFAAAMLLYLSAPGIGLHGFRPSAGAGSASSGGLDPAPPASLLETSGRPGTSGRLGTSSGPVALIGGAARADLVGRASTESTVQAKRQLRTADPVERATGGHGVMAAGRAEPATAVQLIRDPSVSTAAGLQAAVPPADDVTGPVVGGRVQPPRVLPPDSAAGSYRVVRGHDRASVAPGGRVIRYRVEVERGLPFDAKSFAADVHRILNDPRGWGRNGRLGFERVDHGRVELIISLSSPRLTDVQCAPLRTLGRVSCWNGHRSVINARRWGIGARTYGRDLLSYREYLINHEVGHALGQGHVHCPRRGWLAPIMVQQTKSLEGCKANPWPNPRVDRRR
ncbi:MAG TPA: DUF3152 domain-containing protein [Actinomycetes bacterium]|nr:DUF3152 domain-containing protein [Actinomycetes bacterium]